MGSPERVIAACDTLRELIGPRLDLQDLDSLYPLLPLIEHQRGAKVAPLFDLLDELSMAAEHPWPLLAGMISVGDTALACRGLQRALTLTKSDALSITRETAIFFAEQMAAEHSPLMDPECLALIAEILCYLDLPVFCSHRDTVFALYLEETETSLRILAARILDLKSDGVAGADVVEKVLGSKMSQFLLPYLRVTPPSHMDLVHLASTPGTLPSLLSQLQKAQDSFGQELVATVIAELGWEAICLGIDFYDYVNIRVENSFPLMVHSSEAPLIMDIKGARRFALLLSGKDEDVRSSALVARLAVPLEQTLRFQATGSINGHEVQRARLAFFEEDIFLYTLRDETGEIVLAMFSRE
jgi:hypothetical protein